MLCDYCARPVDDCVLAKNQALTDFAVLLVLKEHGYAESVDRVVHQWRQHALPLCSSLAID
jgi:hypothetical protein